MPEDAYAEIAADENRKRRNVKKLGVLKSVPHILWRGVFYVICNLLEKIQGRP